MCDFYDFSSEFSLVFYDKTAQITGSIIIAENTQQQNSLID